MHTTENQFAAERKLGHQEMNLNQEYQFLFFKFLFLTFADVTLVIQKDGHAGSSSMRH